MIRSMWRGSRAVLFYGAILCVLGGAVVLFKANQQDANLVRLPDREQFHIYLLMGQSNMSGRDHRPEPLSLPVAAKRIWVMDERGGWALLKEPIQHIGVQKIDP